MSRVFRFLAAIAAFLFGRRRAKEEQLREEGRQAALVERLKHPAEPPEDEAARAEMAERATEEHEQIRRRRAEPPPTLQRELPATPRIETVVALLLLGAAAAAGGFIVFYVAFPDNQLLGLTLGGSMVLLAAAAILAGKRLVPQEKAVAEYHYYGDHEQQADVQEILSEAGDGVSRRRLLIGAAGAAGATVGAAALIPAASLGPSVGARIWATPWKSGRRVVREDGRPVLADEVTEGLFLTAFPEGASREELGSPIILVRVPPAQLTLPASRREGAPLGILAFSKICPHAGCAVSMYREPLFPATEPKRALVCPCHYSTFDPGAGGRLLFGPAGRDLPQLPLRITTGNELEAAGDFYDAIGPSYGGSRLKPG